MDIMSKSKFMPNYGPLWKMIKMIDKYTQMNHVEEAVDVKWCIPKLPEFSLNNAFVLDNNIIS